MYNRILLLLMHLLIFSEDNSIVLKFDYLSINHDY